jgi:ABC-type multidrug transport system ATPase subunit
MDSLGFPKDWIARPIVILTSFIFFFLILSALGLRFIKVEMAIARTRTSDTDLSAGKEKMTARCIAAVRSINLELDRFALGLDKRTATGKKLPRKMILNPITATFQAGMLNVILGPSGCGKTSLLNALALRLRNSIGTKYQPSGNLTFNGAVPSDSVIRSVCSYVCQDDSALLPSLTVHETLRFAARLRLPSFMSTKDKDRRAGEVLLKLGLKDCADTLIGSDLIKGISGGEKRRVTIAVQILTDPRILLLDEPTSGLDAFTASSIMEVLQGLANEGRTLILTIQQARSDIFKSFGSVLLLAGGGVPIYAGPAREMLRYFSRQGYNCPQNSNPADYALDLIKVDLQRDHKEAESMERAKRLIELWKKLGDGGKKERWKKAESIEEKWEDRGIHYGDRIASATGKNKKMEDMNPEERAPGEYPPPVASAAPCNSLNKADLSNPAELGALKRKPASLAMALPLLLRRTVINTRRQPLLIMARTLQVIGVAVIFTLFFAPLGNDYYAVQNRMGFVQQLGAFYFVGMLQNVAIYPSERDVFYREDEDRAYGVEAFLASYTITEVPFEIISSLIFGLLMCLAVGLPRTTTMYFVCVYACFCLVSCGESLGIMFNTLFGHTGFAVNIMGVFLTLANIMAGVLSINMPEAFSAINYLSPIRYATRAVAPYSLRGVAFTCTAGQRLPDGSCPIETGEDVLKLYHFDVDPVMNIVGLAACVVVYRVLAWGLLRAMKARWTEKTWRETKQ